MKLVFTATADADMETIGDYIALENPLRAVSFIREIRGKCIELREVPEAFPLVSRHEATGIRRRVHGNYLIFTGFTNRLSKSSACFTERWTTVVCCFPKTDRRCGNLP